VDITGSSYPYFEEYNSSTKCLTFPVFCAVTLALGKKISPNKAILEMHRPVCCSEGMKELDALRRQVVEFLGSSHAHASLDAAIKGIPVKLRGKKPKGAEHTAWQLLEHIRIAQWDILEFSRTPKHVSPAWPDGYWPSTEAPPSTAAWSKSVRQVEADLKEMQKLVSSKKSDLFAPIPHGTGQTLLREALLLADHNAYHVGALVLLRRLLGCW